MVIKSEHLLKRNINIFYDRIFSQSDFPYHKLGKKYGINQSRAEQICKRFVCIIECIVNKKRKCSHLIYFKKQFANKRIKYSIKLKKILIYFKSNNLTKENKYQLLNRHYNMSDYRIKSYFTKNSCLNFNDVPNNIILLYRTILLINRFIKQKKEVNYERN